MYLVQGGCGMGPRRGVRAPGSLVASHIAMLGVSFLASIIREFDGWSCKFKSLQEPGWKSKWDCSPYSALLSLFTLGMWVQCYQRSREAKAKNLNFCLQLSNFWMLRANRTFYFPEFENHPIHSWGYSPPGASQVMTSRLSDIPGRFLNSTSFFF